MKKVFACLSAVALMLVAFGLFAKPVMVSAVEVAEGKFIEDPTLEDGDLPIYVMNSIRTTFPSLYDANAQPDANYGIGRDYYWNEIKLVVPQFANNAATGKQYTVYTQGTYSESTKTAAATKIYIWGVDPADGKVKTGTVTGGTASYSGTYAPLFGDVSLSGVRYNLSGQEIDIPEVSTSNGICNGDGNTDCFYIVFDGQGKAVRGVAHENYTVKENVEAYGYNPLFAYKDGKIVIREDVAGGQAVNGFGAADADLDREQIAVPNPDDPVLDPVTGEPMYDAETGEPMYNTMNVDGENANLLFGKRYVWQWYSEEDFANVKVNSVQYLEEGWLFDRWDYAYADPNGGYVCLALTDSVGKFHKSTDAIAKCNNDSVKALLAAEEITAEEAAAMMIPEEVTTDAETGAEVVVYTHQKRGVCCHVVIPVDGISYRYGYLDYSGAAVTEMHLGKFCPLMESAMLYGRNEDYQAYARTYNFTATGLQTQNAVVEGQSYIVREENGKLLVEVKKGATIKPSELIKIQGMLGGYGIVGKPAKEAGSNVAAVMSYKQCDVSELSYIMDINGEHIMWAKRYKYESFTAAVDDFIQVLVEWKRSKGVTIGEVDRVSFANNTYGKFADGDWATFKAEVPEWNWFAEYYDAKFAEQAAADAFTGYTLAQANGIRWGMYAFANQTKAGSWPYSPDFSKTNFDDFWDVCPEPDPFLYESMDECIQAFAAAYSTYYGKTPNEGLTNWSDVMEGSCGDPSWTYDAFFNDNPEWKFFLDYYTKEISSTNRSSGAAWEYDVTSKFAWRQAFQAWALKYEWGSWPYSPDFTNRSDEAYFIGINAVMPSWSEAKYEVPGTVNTFDEFTLDLEVTNKATGIVDTLQITFQMVKEFTPIIKIDQSALLPVNGKVNLANAVKAYDCVYKDEASGIYGSDISRQYLEINAPAGFDPENIAAGTWTLEAVAKCPNETGIVAKQQFVINMLDAQAPEAKAMNNGNIYLVAGEQLTPEKILLYAFDNKDGDYLATKNAVWYSIKCDYDPEDCEVGDSYNGTITVMDANGNSVNVKFTLTLTGADVDFSELEEKIESLLEEKADKPAGDNEQEEASAGCISLAYVSSFIAAAGLALIILKKRH